MSTYIHSQWDFSEERAEEFFGHLRPSEVELLTTELSFKVSNAISEWLKENNDKFADE